MSRRSFVASALPAAASARSPAQPRAKFALLADAQYADKDTWGAREYRRSLRKLEECRRLLEPEQCDFTIHLGDLIDEGVENLRAALPVFDSLPGPRYHLVGNHDCDVPRRTLLPLLGLKSGYYAFIRAGIRFLVLDGMDAAVAGGWPAGSRQIEEGERMLAALQSRQEPNAQTWNGGAGQQQLRWFEQELSEAASRRLPVVVLCHFPLHPDSCRPSHLLWNWRDVQEIIRRHGNVSAWINGHDHAGGWAEVDSAAYFTLPGLVEAEPAAATYVAEVWNNRLVFRHPGAGAGREIKVR